MRTKFFDTILILLKKHSIGLIPCTENEVRELEARFDLKLPPAYREYLLLMGKYSGKINAGTDCFYSDLFDLKDAAYDLLRFNKVMEELPLDAFVFSMHQGYEFRFFKLSDGENPPVYSFSEGNFSNIVFKKVPVPSQNIFY